MCFFFLGGENITFLSSEKKPLGSMQMLKKGETEMLKKFLSTETCSVRLWRNPLAVIIIRDE